VIRPGDAPTLARIADAEKLMAQAQDKAKQDAEFARLISEGDANVKASKYAEGITNFKAALVIRPGDAPTLARIADAEKLLSQLSEKAKQDAEFNRLISEGDANVKASKYAEGITNFKAALVIRPGDAPTLARIADAEKLLSQLSEKAKQDAEFARLISEGDANVKASKYAEGITNFKAALVIRPGDAPTLARIADAEKLLSQLSEKAKQDAEFNRLISEGDANVKAAKYVEGITNFKAALVIRPGDAPTLARIADAEKLLSQLSVKAKQDAEFNRLISEGDANVRAAKYAEGITNFKAALVIRPGDAPTLARIADAEKLLSQLSVKAKQDAEFNRLISEGDANVRAAKYAEGITNFKAALVIRPADAQTLVRISNAEKLLAQLLEKNKLYQTAINRGAAFFESHKYHEAISAYREAQQIKPSEPLPPQKIREIQAILDAMAAKTVVPKPQEDDQKLSSSEKLYLDKTKLAEDNFKNAQWTIARFYYMEALKIKPGDKYLLDKIETCDKMIEAEITAEKVKEFKTIITSADDQMKNNNYSAARFYYHSALEIMKWDSYSIEQLKIIDKLITDQLSQSDQRLFKEYTKKGDDAYNQKEYPGARFYYEKAKEISETDHVTSRLKEIETFMNRIDTTK